MNSEDNNIRHERGYTYELEKQNFLACLRRTFQLGPDQVPTFHTAIKKMNTGFHQSIMEIQNRRTAT